MRIYLDHNATTPVRPEVVEAMTRALRDGWGNPSSVHAEGAAARAAVERAREQVAELVGARPAEVVFTAGATEANNTALHGALALRRGREVVTTCVEHPSVEEPLRALEAQGVRVVRLAVDAGGRVDPAEAAAVLSDETALLAAIWGQNETGVLQPVEGLAEAAHARGVWVHLDATQAVGKIPVDLRRLPAQLLSASAHKLGGPKGAGFLVQRGAALPAWMRGGTQERGRRAGTENVAGVVGLGVACALAERELGARQREWARLRDRLWDGIRAKVPRVQRNGDPAHVLPNTLNVEFEGADGEALLQALDLDGIAVSSGAACHSGSLSPSPVLLAMGLTPARAAASLRLSVGHGTSDADVERVLLVLPDLVARVREAVTS